jgi:hypothetical protein
MVENPYEAPQTRAEAAAPLAGSPQSIALHALCLTIYYVMGIIWGTRNVYYWEESILDLLVPLGMGLLLSSWAMFDSRVRGHPIPLLVSPLFFLLAGLLVPGYVIWSRGWYGLGLVAIHAVAWYGLCLVSMFIGRMAVFGVPFGQ